jgi:phosphate-selective porin OprO/OprP
MRLSPLLIVLASLLLAASAAYSQGAGPSIADLWRRMDALERENRELRSAITQQPAVTATGFDQHALHYAGDENRIRSVVEDCLTERGLQPASAEAWVEAPRYQSAANAGTPIGQDLAMSATWRNGLELTTKDKSQRIHIGGRWQFDTSWFSADQAVQNNLPGNVQYHDGVDFRRARLRIDGTMYEVIEYAMEYDFVNGSRLRNANNSGFVDFDVTALTDMWLQFSHTPLGNIRVGNQKEAIGFEHLVSSRFLPFMERSYNQDTFYGGTFNGFTPGASVTSNIWEDRASYNIGLYKPTNNVFAFNTNDGDYAITGRLTWLPIYEEEGRQVLHLGVSAREATTYEGLVRFRTRDAARAGTSSQWPVPADVITRGDRMHWLNFEFCALQGPWTLQAEWLTSFTSNARATNNLAQGIGPRVDSLFYQGGYVQLLYFLTGESDNYSLERMALDRVKPFENYFWVRGEDGHLFGRGAWQLGARYNYLDLNDQDINGGILHNFTTGVNWFFNPNTKWQFNYIATYRDVSQTANFPDGSGWIHGWGMRFAQDF